MFFFVISHTSVVKGFCLFRRERGYPITTTFKLVGHVGKKSHLSSSLDCYGKLSLVKSTSTGYASGKDLSSLGDELSELSYVLVVNSLNLILAEDANLLSSVHRTEGALILVSIHLNSPFNLSDSRFLYCSLVVSLANEDGFPLIRREDHRR